MSLSDSMFLFEIVVEELKSYVGCKEFYIRSKFADVFSMNLKDPNDQATILPKRKKLKKKKATVRSFQSPMKDIPEGRVQSGQSILFASNIDMLISSMKRFPIELSLWDKDDIDNMMGSTHIPWSPVYIDYLHKITIKQDPAPAFVSGGYNIFDEYSSKRMATIRLNIKLTYLKDKITTSFRSLSEDNQKTFMYTGFNSKATTVLSTVNDNPDDLIEETGIIKTIYGGGKRRLKTGTKAKLKTTKKPTNTDSSAGVHSDQIKELESLEEPEVLDKTLDFIHLPDKKCKINQSIASLVKSHTNLDRNKQIEVIKTKSCSSVNQEQYNILNYIFSDDEGPYGNQVYCVGYFTVENDFAKSSATLPSSKESVEDTSEQCNPSSKGRFKFKLCDSQCPSQKTAGSCSESVCSIDLPAEAADLITITKCKEVDCDSKKHKEVPEQSDERILLDLKNLTQECCDVKQKVEEVAGGMKAKMKFKEDDCYCSCECTFGFVKKTTYCGVCGGFEKPGEDFSLNPPQDTSALPFPCPIFHKLVDKSKLKSWSTSGSDTKKKVDDSQRNLKAGAKSIGSAKSDKNAESEKDSKKGKKKKKDDRFKFNYGYTAPQIGHSQCAMPCTGTRGAVPRNMGWLWTAEDVPGIRAGWRPGAVTKRVLRHLNRVKKRSTSTQQSAPAKKQVQQVGDKPTLIICKRNGEYIVEMKAENHDKRTICNPLIYRIAAADNPKNVKAKARKERRLVRKAVEAVWSDPYNPDACQETCYKAYRQAIGYDHFDPCDPECVCPEQYEDDLDSCSFNEDMDADSEASSLDVDWEIHFTPPSAFRGKPKAT